VNVERRRDKGEGDQDMGMLRGGEVTEQGEEEGGKGRRRGR
jgi:hypothetical protein